MRLDELIVIISNRINMPVNQSLLAESLGITRQTVSNRIKNESEVTVSELRRVEEFFKINLFNCGVDEGADIAYIDYYTDVFASCGEGSIVFSSEKTKLPIAVSMISGYSKNKLYSMINASGNIASVGGIVGLNRGGTIQGCQVISTDLKGSYSVGGIAGYNNSTIEACSFQGKIEFLGDSYYGLGAGGIAGSTSTTITGCWAITQFTNQGGFIGGLVGDNGGGSINACYWKSDVSSGIGNDTYKDGNLSEASELVSHAGDMNAKLAECKWQWVVNTDESTKENVPLVIKPLGSE